MKRCKITVLKREFYEDVVDKYIPFAEFGPCHMMKEGDVFITSGPFGNNIPQGFCNMAWHALSLHATTIAWGGKIWDHSNVYIGCCNDGARPVIFKLEPYEDEQEQAFVYKD